MQTLRKKTSPCKYRNDPGRFFGDGVTFKAKLIGILEVGEARGDRMCQEALQDLKMAIRAAGEHKQRITIHVTIDGLRLRDEKTGDSLYHHPVHKISFIAQDMTDSRAFGYIFGSPDSGHRFFGIKTDKAASQVVLAMRDLFQVVFELKKKEIEMARQQIQSKTIHEHQPISLNVKSTQATETANTSFSKNTIETSKSNAKEMSPESVADLVDLEQELSSIQRGITQMERITPSEPTAGSKGLSEEDPFGDSFTNFPQYNLLPPPEQSRSRHSKPMKPPDNNTIPDVPIQAHNTTQPTTNNIPIVTNNINNTNNSNNSNNNNNNQNMKNSSTTEHWLENTEDVATFEGTKSMDSSSTSTTHHPSVTSQTSHDDNQIQITGEEFSKNHVATTTVAPSTTTTQTQYIDAFTDLDPLGTGKSKPYIDKKYFFQDLKNPPKKVLKDLSGQDGTFAATFSGNEATASTTTTNSKTDVVFERASESFDSVTGLSVDNKSSIDFIPQTKVLHQQTSLFPSKINSHVAHNDKVFNIDIERAKMDEPVMMPRDTDPFSPTRKKSDPFQDGDIFSKLDPFDFDFTNKNNSNNITQDTQQMKTLNGNGDGNGIKLMKKDGNMFNGPLQVTLPPESWTTSMAQKKIERQTSESPTSIPRNRPSVFKQNTVDVISSISSKKMPHLFGQKFSKRDSNSINMRRLQESDSLSENETAPEPPPRPESISHVEPPPLPPKKQFSDIIIRPRITSSSAIPPPIRYDYVTSKMKNTQGIMIDSAAPPIPLPSRKIGRSDTNFPGPGRPGRKPAGEEDDYLTPITSRNDVPPLLPPPQTKSGRHRRLEHVEHKTEPEVQPVKYEIPPDAIIPDITLSQLLTLGIDELATKLNVPTTKLSTMTLVELTRYLSDFIESSKKVTPPPPPPPPTTTAKVKTSSETAVFKVNFDQHSDATFIAKFDDNFGEEQPTQATFVANFSDFDERPQTTTSSITVTKPSTVPPADRYAVFREIIEQEMQNETGSIDDNSNDADDSEEKNESDTNVSNEILNDQISPIDTKITEVISHAKDRYAALRDIILVEDLFEKPIQQQQQPENTSMETIEGGSDDKDDDQDVFTDAENDKLPNEESSPEIMMNNDNDNFVDTIETETSGETRQTPEIRQNGTLIQNLTVASSSNKDDLEIDEFMNRAISNLSLDSRGEHLSPIATTKSPTSSQNNNTTPPNAQIQQIKTSVAPIDTHVSNVKSQFNDMSTSPIPLQKSPAQKSPASKSPISKSPLSKSPIPQSPAVTSLIDASKRTNSGSLSDVICGSSPEADNNIVVEQKPSNATTESWAIFDQPATEKKSRSNQNIKSPKVPSKELAESPCSSDGKDEWKGDQEYGKRWPKGQTSSSSRDLSPWDDEGSDYKKRPPPAGADRHGYYMRHARRMNSCDDDYEYEEECMKRRERRLKAPTSRSRENFDLDSQNWYHHSNHHNWSPPEDDEARPRPFERAVYERNTYGPPFEKRDHKLAPHMSYDRRDYKNYDKRKYYRDYSRPEYEFESYGESPDTKDRKFTYYPENFDKPKCRRDYENIYEDEFSREVRGQKQKSREYAYDRDRKSFDRDSVESYESTGRRHKSFGSGDVYGSLDSRSEFRERYMTSEKSRSLRKGMKLRSTEEYEHDSENDVQMRRPQNETRSLQRPPQGTRIRKSSGSSPWDGEEIPPIPGQKNWKRPSSASESDRRLTENRRVLCHTLSGSDGEKERRFRKKPRPKGKEVEVSRQQSFGTMRYSTHRDVNYDYIDYEEYEQPPIDEDKFERLNRRRQDMHQRMMEADRRKKPDKYNYEEDETVTASKYTPKKESFYPEKERYMSHKFEDYEEPKSSKSLRREFDFDDFEDTPRSNASSSKFNFDDHGFESDFNSPPPPPPPPTSSISASTKASFRFSNDFTEKEKQTIIQGNYEQDYNTTPSQKLRFDDKVTISKFESDSHGAFEDDFSKAEFVFEDNEDQWNPEIPPKKNSLRLTKRQENIKKSESVNIFAKKVDDPFEDDDFFKTTTPNSKDDNSQMKKSNGGDDAFQWDSNFAKFDENM